jgi:hypothetical protein
MGPLYLQAFTALFHGGFNGVPIRLLILKELVADVEAATLSRADINAKRLLGAGGR